MTRTLAITLAAAGLAVAAPSAASAADSFKLTGTPKLYTVKGEVGLGRPTAYVMFQSANHLHDPQVVVVRVGGQSGRTYATRRDPKPNCYRSTSHYTSQEKPSPRLKHGVKYQVTFQVRTSSGRKTVATRTLAAHWFEPPRTLSVPSC